MKRSVSLLLVLCMLMSLLPTGVVAAEETAAQSAAEALWEYASYGSGVELTVYNGTATDIYVPAEVDGNAVVKLGDSLFEDNDAVNSVTLAEGITEIGARTFCDADALVCIVTNQTLTTIGAEAFSSCDSFNSVILYDAVTAIGDNAFADCPSLTIWCNEGTAGYTYATANGIAYEILNPEATPETVVQDGVTYYIMNGEAIAIDFDESTTEVTIPAIVKDYPVTEIRETFRDFTKLTAVILPNSLRLIGGYAFYNCTALDAVKLPDGVTYISEYAFYNCSCLTHLDIPDGATFIGGYAFQGCEGITSFVIPEGVTEINQSTFSNCVSLTDITVPEGVTSIASGSFSGCSSLEQISLPSSLTSIGSSAFKNCGITEITIPDGVTMLGASAFAECNGLQKITIPGSVSTIDSYAFSNCDNLMEATIADGVKYVKGFAFKNCPNLRKVTVAGSVGCIYSYAFIDCIALSDVTLMEGIRTIQKDAFKNCTNLIYVIIPESASVWYDSFSNRTTLLVYENSAVPAGRNLVIAKNREPEIYLYNDIYYLIADGEATAFNYVGTFRDLVVPAEVNGYPVTCLDETFRNCSIGSVTLPESLKIIDGAFYQSTLQHISIPEGVTSIRGGAFYECKKLTSVDLPSTLTALGSFYGCVNLQEITIPAGIKTIGQQMFSGCTKLRTVELPEGLEAIEYSAFYGCINLTELTLPASVKTIGTSAFYGCTGLESITLPEGLETIGYGAFEGCTSLVKLIIPQSVTSIDGGFENTLILVVSEGSYAQSYALENDMMHMVWDGTQEPECYVVDGVSYCIVDEEAIAFDCDSTVINATVQESVAGYPVTRLRETFRDCKNLTEVTLPSSLTAIEGYTFYDCRSLKRVVIPESVTAIEAYTFYNCGSLEQIVMSDYVTKIGEYAFYHCESLSYCELPAKLSSIGVLAFYECGLKEIAIPDGVTSIPAQTFRNCLGLTSVVFSDNVISIADNAFDNCALTDISWSKKLQKIGNYAFSSCDDLTEVIIPGNVTTIGDGAFSHCSNLEKVAIMDGVLVVGGGAFQGCTRLKEMAIPDSVRYIYAEAFRGCKALSEIGLPETLRSLGDYVFAESGIVQITIPSGITQLGAYAFYKCTSLTDITMSGVQSVGKYAFSECTNLKTFTLPANVATVGEYAFYKSTGLECLTIDSNDVQIGDWAFRECEKLSQVIINGTVDIDKFAFCVCDNLSQIVVNGTVKNIGGSAFSGNEKLSEVVVNGVIEAVDTGAFKNSGLINIVLTEGTRSIGADAFADCNFFAVLMPKSITSLDATAFRSNTILLVHENSYAHSFAVENNLLYFVLHKTENPEIAYGAAITGTAAYTDGTVAAGVTVEIFYDDGTLKESVTTDDTGAYSFTYAEVGGYTVRVTDANGNTASTQVSVKRMNAFDVFLSGDTALTLKKAWSVSGTVSESPATVTLTDEDGNILASVETADGSFTLENIPNGTYIIKAETENGSVTQEVTVFDGIISDLTLTVASQTATVWGYVEVEDRAYKHHRRNWVQVTVYNDEGIIVDQTRSDSEGKYIFSNLPLGEYAIVAETAEMRPDHKGKGYDRSYTLTGYAYVNAEEAATYQAEDIVLYEENDYTATISGKVTAHGESQVCEVILRNVFRHEVARYTTGSNGKYTFKNIPDGLYIITARTESDGMGYAVVAVRHGKVHGDPDITVYKSDKLKDREESFRADFEDCRDENEARNRRARIAEEKRFYDGLSKKEKDQLSDEYVRRLNELVEWAASCQYTADEGVTVEGGGLTVSGAELESEQTVTFEINVNKRDKWQTSTDGVKTREDFIQHEMEDAAGDREIGTYYEITMTKTVDGEAHAITSVCKDTDTTGKFRVTLEIPEEYRGHKHYSFIHVHHGEPVELTDLDDNPNTVTFEVDRFSTFALTYSDVDMVQPNASDIEVHLADGSVLWAESNADAVAKHLENQGSYLRVTEDGAAIEIPEGETVCIDLCGRTATVTGSGTLLGMDSANDAFTASTGAATVADTVTLVTDVTGGANGYRYIALTADDGTCSFHRLDMKLTAVTLRTSACGIYYKAQYDCDETLAAAVESYGVVFSLNDMPGADFLTEQGDLNCHTVAAEPFTRGVTATSGSVFGIMKTERDAATNAQYGQMPIYANAYICIGGQLLVADTDNVGKTVSDEGFQGTAYSLYDTLKAIDSNWSAYDEADQAALKAFYSQWAEQGMSIWADTFENIDA